MDPEQFQLRLPTGRDPHLSPTKDEAEQFALMVTGGMPPTDAIRYFYDTNPPNELQAAQYTWMRSPHVKRAILDHQRGKSWQGMTLDERIDYTINKHYSEMAYFLYSHNYATLMGPDKAKADTCRTALEAKLAGTAGQLNPLERFWDDVRRGVIQLVKPAGAPVKENRLGN